MSWLTEPWGSEIVRLAGIELILLGSVAGALGVFVVLRGLTFATEALAHAVLPGAIAAAILGGPIAVGAAATASIAALALGESPRRRASNDTAMGVALVAALALAGMMLSQRRDIGRGVESFLFGRVLGVDGGDLLLTAGVALGVCCVLLLTWRTLVAATFDPEAARAAGLPVRATDLALVGALAAVVVVALSAVGSLLTLALLVTPAVSARLLVDRMVATVVVAAAIGAASGVGGLLISYWWGVASGGAVVLVASGTFVVALLLGHRGLLGRALAPRQRHALQRP